MYYIEQRVELKDQWRIKWGRVEWMEEIPTAVTGNYHPEKEIWLLMSASAAANAAFAATVNTPTRASSVR